MPLSDVAAAELLDLLFLNQNFGGIGDAGGLQPSAAAGSFHISLHTADPGLAGTQLTSEAAYTGYARVAVPRTAPGFTRTGRQVSNTALVTFPACTGGTAAVTHFSIGLAASGAGVILASGPLAATLSVSNAITPLFNAGALVSQAV